MFSWLYFRATAQIHFELFRSDLTFLFHFQDRGGTQHRLYGDGRSEEERHPEEDGVPALTQKRRKEIKMYKISLLSCQRRTDRVRQRDSSHRRI